MSCEKYREMVSALFDNELSTEEQKVLLSHLESCSDCGRFADELESFKELGSSVPAEQMPTALETSILCQTVGSVGQKKSLWSHFSGYYRVPRGLAWAAMLAALLLITDAIVESNLRQTTVDETPAEVQIADDAVKKIVLSDDDIVSASIILKPTGDG